MEGTRECHRSGARPLCPRQRGGHGLSSGIRAGAGRTSSSGPTGRGRVFRTSALASSGGLGCLRVRRAAELSVPGPRVSVCQALGMGRVVGGVGALVLGAIWLAEWCWQPYREAQARLRQKQTEILRALEGRANEEDSA